jgi:hypothetical protein
MGQRVNVGLVTGAEWALVEKDLIEAGAESVRPPSPELPDVLIVTIPDHEDVREFVRRARELPGVRYAEPDSWQFSL